MFREYEGGIELKQTGKYDMKGWVPVAIQNYVSKKVCATSLFNVVNYYKDGVLPNIDI